MKTIIKFFWVAMLSLGFWACIEDDGIVNEPTPGISITMVNFSLENQTVPEDGDSLKVNLSFDRAATADGVIPVRLSGDAVYLQNFSTSPSPNEGVISLNVEKGQAAASFLVTPVNDEDSLGDKTIRFTLEKPSAGFKLGSKIISSVALIEDDTTTNPGNEENEAIIGFGEDVISISENDAEGLHISLLLEGSVKHTEYVFINVLSTEGFFSGTDYIIDPLAILGEIKLEVNPGAENLKFRIAPVDDRLLSGNFELKFTISNVSDGIKKGAQTSLTVEVEEDDIINPASLHTIADLRAEFEKHTGDWAFSDDYYIEGIITSDKNVVDEKVVYIQDATGGIMLVFNAPRLMKKGDKVQVNLKNANGHEINGQIAMTGVEDRAGITLGHSFEVVPEVITLAQLHSGKYQGKWVRLLNVSFTNADGVNTWLGTQRFSDGNRYGFSTAFATADFSQKPLPTEKVNITGIVGDWNRLQPQDYFKDVVIAR